MIDPAACPYVRKLEKYLFEYDYHYVGPDGRWAGHWFSIEDRSIIIGMLIEQEYCHQQNKVMVRNMSALRKVIWS